SNRRSQVEMTLRCPFEAKETVLAIVITINGNNSGEGFLIAPVGGTTFPAPLGLRTDDGSSVAATLQVAAGGTGRSGVRPGVTRVILLDQRAGWIAAARLRRNRVPTKWVMPVSIGP